MIVKIIIIFYFLLIFSESAYADQKMELGLDVYSGGLNFREWVGYERQEPGTQNVWICVSCPAGSTSLANSTRAEDCVSCAGIIDDCGVCRTDGTSCDTQSQYSFSYNAAFTDGVQYRIGQHGNDPDSAKCTVADYCVDESRHCHNGQTCVDDPTESPYGYGYNPMTCADYFWSVQFMPDVMYDYQPVADKEHRCMCC